MSTLTIRAVGLERLQVGFGKFIDSLQPIALDAIERAMQAAEKKSPGWLGGTAYTTAEIPGSDYVRTGVLGRSVQLSREGLSYRLSVAAYKMGTIHEYSVYVVGDAYGKGQA